MWVKVFRNGPSKICGRQPLEIWSNMVCLKQSVFHKFYLVHSRIHWSISSTSSMSISLILIWVLISIISLNITNWYAKNYVRFYRIKFFSVRLSIYHYNFWRFPSANLHLGFDFKVAHVVCSVMLQWIISKWYIKYCNQAKRSLIKFWRFPDDWVQNPIYICKYMFNNIILGWDWWLIWNGWVDEYWNHLIPHLL